MPRNLNAMAEASTWEQRFVEKYIVSSKRERYLAFLKGDKRRQKILERLNHTLDFDERKAMRLESPSCTPDALISLLNGHRVTETCYFMADGNRLDGTEMRLELAISELLHNRWGALIICPPKPVAVYKQEDIGELILLSDGQG
jgi:hypothetical protein